MQKLVWIYLLCFFSLAQNVYAHPDQGDKEQATYYAEKARERDLSPEIAFRYADSLEHIAHSLKDTSLLYDAYKLKGDLSSQQGEYTRSLYWLNNARRIARDQQDTLSLVRVVNNLGLIYYNTARYDKALESFIQAHSLGANYLTRIQHATVLNNAGLVYEQLGQNEVALNYYQNSLSIFQQEEESIGMATVHADLGSLYRKIEDKEKALEHLRQARSLYEEEGSENGIARVLNEIALVYLKDSPEVSIEYLRLSKKVYVKNNNKSGLYQLNKNGGDAYVALKEYAHAEAHYKLALAYADSLGNNYDKGEIYLRLARMLEKQQDFEKAAQYYKEYVALEKNVFSRELINSIATTKADYELDLKDSQIRRLEEQASSVSDKLRSRSFTLILLAVLSIITVVFTIVFLLKFKSASRVNRMLKARSQLILSQKEEIRKQHDLIRLKNKELEKARQKNEVYNQELLAIKERLEEKVKERTRQLEDTYRKLSFHIHNTPLAILEWNSQQELTHWPYQAEAIFGYTAEEMLGLTINEVPFLLPEDRHEMQEVIKQLKSGALSQQYYTKVNIDKTGKKRYVEWNYSILLNDEGGLESILTIANDVSMREEAFRELKGTNQELDTFLYKSSHDLRGPIARMQGIINLGLLETTDVNARLYFDMLKKVTEDLNGLLLRLLMVHNINQHEYEAEEIPFHSFVDTIITNYCRKKQGIESVTIVNKIAKELILQADKTLLEIVLVNLLENSLSFTDNFNPRVEFDAVYLPSGKYIITVSDNGLGIPADYHEKIFDMFFQGSTRSTGTGLGLYMARKATKRLLGDIRFKSGTGQTVFEVVLPAEREKQAGNVQLMN